MRSVQGLQRGADRRSEWLLETVVGALGVGVLVRWHLEYSVVAPDLDDHDRQDTKARAFPYSWAVNLIVDRL